MFNIGQSYTTGTKWIFNNYTTRGWKLTNDIFDHSFGENYLVINPGPTDPYMDSPLLNINPDQINYIKIVGRNFGATTDGHIYIRKEGWPYYFKNNRNLVGFTFPNTKNTETMFIPLTQDDFPDVFNNDENTITQIRIDPVGQGVPNSDGDDNIFFESIEIGLDNQGPELKVVFPTSTSIVKTDSDTAIQWKATDLIDPDLAGNVSIYYKENAGDYITIEESYNNTGVYLFKFPQTTNALELKICASDKLGNTNCATSGSFYTLNTGNQIPFNQKPSISFTSPPAYSTITKGVTSPLVFSVSDDSGEIDFIRITYSYNNNDFYPLIDEHGTSGWQLPGSVKYFHWMPSSIADYIRIKISAFDKQGEEGFATHDYMVVEQSVNENPPDTPEIFDPKTAYGINSFTLRWVPVSNVESYRIKEIHNNSSVVLSTKNTYYSFLNKSNGVYFYKIKAVNQQGESDWSAPVERSIYVITNVSPKKPILISPRNNTVDIPQKGGIRFTWSNGDPDSWQTPDSKLLLGKDPGSLSLIQNFGSDNAFNTSLNYYGELEPSITYCWQVIARDDDGDETSSDLYYFTTAAKLPFDSPIFMEATETASLSTEYADGSRGIAAVDLDGDDNLDIFAICDKTQNWDAYSMQLYLGNGNGNFTQKFDSFSNTPFQGRGVAFADYDRDYDLDMIVGFYQKFPILYRNDGNGVFSDVTIESDLAASTSIGGAEIYPSWADINSDGYPDLFLGAYIGGQNSLFLNNQDGTFTDITASAGVNRDNQVYPVFILGSTWADFDNDGDLDMAAAGPGGGIFSNNGDNTFTPLDRCRPIDATTVFAGDYNNDGWIDLYFVGNGSGHYANGSLAYTPDILYQNKGDGTFENVTQNTGLPVSLTSGHGGTWVDYDNDGWLDLAAGGNFFRNMGDGSFVGVTASIGLMVNDAVYGVAAFDADDDGINDLLYCTQNNRQFFFGGSTSNNWIKVKLKGTLSDTFGVGAQVRIQAQNNFYYRTPSSGTGLGDQNPMIQHFGVGNAQKLNIQVKWLSGVVDEIFDVDVNQTITIIEGDHVDTIAPSTINNLTVYPKSSSEIILAWTAPGDDESLRKAFQYDIRYHTALIDDSNWDLAGEIENAPLPLDAGMNQNIVIGGLNPDTQYFVAIKAIDEAGNSSPISNSPFTRATRGNKIYDLHTTVITTDRVDLAWTVPDVMIKSYKIAYSTNPIGQGNWDSAAKVNFSGEPGLPGDIDAVNINGLLPGETYYFSIIMDFGNDTFSDPSKNLKVKTLLPINNTLGLVGEVDIGSNLHGEMPLISAGDLNGDNINDLLLSKATTVNDVPKTAIEIYFLNANGMNAQPNFTILGNAYIGYYPPQMADLNSDGFSDLIISEPGKAEESFFAGKVYVYYGGPQFDTEVDLIFTGSDSVEYSMFGSAFAVCDFNQDGKNDIAVCERLANTEIKIYYGSISAFNDLPDTIIILPSMDLPNFAGGGCANLNGDDYPDMVFWSVHYFLFILSKSDGLDYDYYFFRKTNSTRNVLGAFNDDGYTDIAFYDWNGNRVGIIFGGKDADWYASPSEDILMSGVAAGHSPLGIVDINNDGILDLLVGDTTDLSLYSGSVKIYLGGSDFDDKYDKLISYEGIMNFGRYLTGIGDITGDGFGEFIAGGSTGTIINFDSVIFKGEDIPKRTDTVPPDKIADLEAASNKPGEVTLSWTAPGADGEIGTAAYYEIRYSASDYAQWDIHPYFYYTYLNPPLPQTAGKQENVIIKDLPPNVNHRFVISTIDDFGNISEKSNTASVKVLSGIEIIEKWQMDNETFNQTVSFDSHIYPEVFSLGDVNGDNYDDLFILFVEWGQGSLLQIYNGSPIWNNTADFSISGDNLNIIKQVFPLGNTNGDDFDDFYINWPKESYFKGGEFVSPIGDGKSDWLNKSHLSIFKRVGDVNGDDYEDFIGSFNNYFNDKDPEGEVCLFLGGATFDGEPDYILHQGAKVDWKGLGDINGDNYADLAISTEGVVSVYCGANEFSPAPTLTISYPLEDDAESSGYGRSLAGLGDINGDGFDDFAVSAPSVDSLGKVFIYYGRTNLSNYPDVTLTGIKGGENFGNKIMGIGDINNDGKQDFLITDFLITENLTSDLGLVYLGDEEQNTLPIHVIDTNDLNGESYNDSDRNFSGVLNFNGDDIPDLLMYGDAKNPQGKVHIYNFHFLDSDSDGIIDINDQYPFSEPAIFMNTVTPQDHAQYVVTTASLSWQIDNQAAYTLLYDLYLGLSPDDMSLIASNLSETAYSFADNPLEYNTVYYWRVIARDSSGQEVLSNVFSFSTEILPKPGQCENIQIIGNIEGIHITWDAPLYEVIEGYYIERKDASSDDFILIGNIGPDETEFIDIQTLVPHENFYYRISAYNSSGKGNPTNSSQINIQNTAPVGHNQDLIIYKNKTEDITLTGKDADDDNLSYEVVNGPSHGTLAGTSPDLVYTPIADYLGVDSLRFRVHDGIENSEEAVINISILLNPAFLNKYYHDADGDGYGDPNNSAVVETMPQDYVQDNTDCDDGNASINPGEIEICDGLDNDCDGEIDDGVLNTYYLDADQDGYGNAEYTTQACSKSSGYVENANDCDDNDDQVVVPIPDFSCSTTLGYMPLTVQFTEKSIGNVNYSWDFGDSGTSNEKDPNHTFTEAGAYNVTLTVDIEGNCLMQKSKTIHALGTATLSGRVLSQDGPIVGAEVQVLGHPEYSAVTGDNGEFTIADLRLGNHTLRVTAFEYETKFEKIINRPGEEIDIYLNGKVGWICGKILRAENNEPMAATVIAFTHEDGFYSRTAQSDPNDGTYIIYLSRFGNYSLLAFSKDYYPYVDSNHGGQYTIDPDNPDTFKGSPDTYTGGIDLSLIIKPHGPKVRVSSFERDIDPRSAIIDNETVINASIKSKAPLGDPNINIKVVDGPILDSNEIIIEDKKYYQAVYSDDIEDIHIVTIRVSAMDQDGTTTTSYSFIVNPGTSATIIGGTSDNITLAEGGESGQMGLINLDLDGNGDYDYDNSYIDVPPCGIVGISGEDPNMILTKLTIRIARLAGEEIGAITAEYDVNLLDWQGNPATGFQINEEHPITIYLHFDSDKFDGNLANLVIKYQGMDMTWKTDGISNIRIEGATIAFDVNHLTRFAAFEENVAPTNLTVHAVTMSQINLSWADRTDNELNFEIWRCVNCADHENIDNFLKLIVVDPNIISYSDNDCTKDNTYYYSVRAVNEFGATDFSNKSGLSLNYCAFPPNAPNNLTTTVNSDSQITLNWQGADPNNSCITNFKIFRSSDSQNWTEIGDTDHNTTSYSNTGLAAETTYYYQVMAANLIGVSDPGNVAQATTQKTPESGSKCFISNIMNSTLLRSFKEWVLSILKIGF